MNSHCTVLRVVVVINPLQPRSSNPAPFRSLPQQPLNSHAPQTPSFDQHSSTSAVTPTQAQRQPQRNASGGSAAHSFAFCSGRVFVCQFSLPLASFDPFFLPT